MKVDVNKKHFSPRIPSGWVAHPWAGGPPFRGPQNRVRSTLLHTTPVLLLAVKIMNFGCPSMRTKALSRHKILVQ